MTTVSNDLQLAWFAATSGTVDASKIIVKVEPETTISVGLDQPLALLSVSIEPSTTLSVVLG